MNSWFTAVTGTIGVNGFGQVNQTTGGVTFSGSLSMATACIMLYLFGHSLNVFTLGGLVLTIGILVDDAIVVVENITRHLEQGMPPLESALKGAKEIGFAVISISVFAVSAVWSGSRVSTRVVRPASYL